LSKDEADAALWKGSVTRHDGIAMSARGEAAPRGEKEETTSIGLTGILLEQK
jgi:hypothetical protein